ncbi:hypothetical protein ACOSQ4_027561 [Xanthoceras sorbifolium]
MFPLNSSGAMIHVSDGVVAVPENVELQPLTSDVAGPLNLNNTVEQDVVSAEDGVVDQDNLASDTSMFCLKKSSWKRRARTGRVVVDEPVDGSVRETGRMCVQPF